MMNYSRQADDARWGAIQNAPLEQQQRMVTEAAQQAAFQNCRAATGLRSRPSAAASSLMRRRRTAVRAKRRPGEFGNLGLAQQLQQQQAASNAARSAAWLLYARAIRAAQPAVQTRFPALLSGGQVQPPNSYQYTGRANPDYRYCWSRQPELCPATRALSAAIAEHQSTNRWRTGLGAGALRGQSDRRHERKRL